MASAFTVMTADLRRANVKVPAGGYMIDVRDEACAKLKLDSEAYQLKHNNKAINLTDPIRAAGLTQNAKLELVVKSKSPSAVTVALRLPPSEARLGLPNNRVAAKVRSDTPLWKLLRHLEDSARPVALNITARGVPLTSAPGTGPGQLYWETPVLRFAGREIASLADFGKTLGQVGIDTGSQLIHLEFRLSDLPLQDAMDQVHQTLEKVTDEAAADKAAAEKPMTATVAETVPAKPKKEQKETTPTVPAQDGPSAAPQTTAAAAAAAAAQTQPSLPDPTTEPMEVDEKPESQPEPQQQAVPASLPTDNAYLEPVQVWRPPRAGTPAAATQAWRRGGSGSGGGDDDDPTTYQPSVAQLQAHQKHLEEAGRNKRLKSEAELAEEARVQAARAAAVRKVDVRIRFPDGHTVLWSLPNGATGATLHAAVRGVLTPAALQQGFRLALPMARGPGDVIQDRTDTPKHDLVRGYGMRGGVLLNYLRGSDAAAAAPRPLPQGQGYLRPEVACKAQDIVVPQAMAATDNDNSTAEAGSSAAADSNKRAANKAEALNKMSKFLRLAKK